MSQNLFLGLIEFKPKHNRAGALYSVLFDGTEYEKEIAEDLIRRCHETAHSDSARQRHHACPVFRGPDMSTK